MFPQLTGFDIVVILAVTLACILVSPWFLAGFPALILVDTLAERL